MKKMILATLFVASFTSIFNAQIPNSGFENWTTIGSYDNPDDWGTMNNTTAPTSVFTATKGTPGSPGSSYLKLTSKTIGPAVVNGIAVSGKLDSTTMTPISGFAFNQTPDNFTGKWQHMIYGSSQGSVSAVLTRWDTGLNARVIVATANQTLSGMAMSWANFSIPFVYTDLNLPDSCIIVLKASGSNPTNLDYLWVDNLAFTGDVASLPEIHVLNEFSVFPNPSTNHFNIRLSSNTKENAEMELIDINGSVVKQANFTLSEAITEHTIDISNLEKGCYVIRINTANGSVGKSVIIE